MRFGVVNERLGAVAALQQERLTPGYLGQHFLKPHDLRRHRHRGNTLQDRSYRLDLLGHPTRLLCGGLGQRGVQPGPQIRR